MTRTLNIRLTTAIVSPAMSQVESIICYSMTLIATNFLKLADHHSCWYIHTHLSECISQAPMSDFWKQCQRGVIAKQYSQLHLLFLHSDDANQQ